jgi:hypothetical protein
MKLVGIGILIKKNYQTVVINMYVGFKNKMGISVKKQG